MSDLWGVTDSRFDLALALRAAEPWANRDVQLSRPDREAKFLAHVVGSVPRYRSDRGHNDSPRLDDFPLVTRRDYDRDRSSFFSSAFSSSPGYRSVMSSGTTGRPIVLRVDLAAWYELNYATYAFLFESIPVLASAVTPGSVSVALCTTKSWGGPRRLVLPSLNFSLLQRCVLGQASSQDAEILAYLRQEEVPLAYGKPSYLLTLLRLDTASRSSFGAIAPRALFVSGENLFNNHRRLLEGWFGCPLINGYTSAEGGLVALECPLGGGLHVRTDRVVLEVLDVDGTVAAEGYGELVLTNLWNWATAFVRYRTGDRGMLELRRCPCGYHGSTITHLDGREATIFSGPCREVETRTLDELFESVGVVDFQLVRRSDRFTLRWVPASDHSIDREHRALVKLLRDQLGPVTLECEPVGQLSRLGSKARRYIDES